MTLREAVQHGQWLLEEAGSSSAALDARLLLAEAAGVDSTRLMMESGSVLAPEKATRFGGFCSRRAAGEPVAYILGRHDFYKHSFIVSPDVLVPRPETEHLIEAVLEYFPQAVSLLDIGTGSGIIPVTLKEELPGLLRCVAGDISFAALCVARRNAEVILGTEHGVDFIESDIYSAVTGRFDLIVSNPPYLTLEEYAAVEPGVRNYEPQLALVAGVEGMDCYRKIIFEARDHLHPGGGLVLEVSDATAKGCAAFAEATGLRVLRLLKDYAGHERVLVLRRGPG